MSDIDDRLERVYRATKEDECKLLKILTDKKEVRQTQALLLEQWRTEPEPGNVSKSFVWVRSCDKDGWGRDWKLAGIDTPLMFDWTADRVPGWWRDLILTIAMDDRPSGFLTESIQWCRSSIDGPPGLKERAEMRAKEFFA